MIAERAVVQLIHELRSAAMLNDRIDELVYYFDASISSLHTEGKKLEISD